MPLIYNFVTTILITFLIFSNVEAQINPVYKIMRQRGWTPQSINDKTKLTPNKVNEKFLISMGYNHSTISNLQKVGVDLLKLYGSYRNVKRLTAVSDCIVIGSVARKEYPLRERASFHTIAYIQVEEFLRNDYNLPKDQIPVMIESGPTASGGRVIAGDEDTLRTGEHVLLFLTANGLIIMANYSHMYKLYEQLINDRLLDLKSWQNMIC